MSKPRCAVQVLFTIKPEHFEDFRPVILAQAKNSLEKEPGCHQFDVATIPELPHSIHLYETYDDRAAFDAHRETSHFAEFSAKISDWVEEKQVHICDIL